MKKNKGFSLVELIIVVAIMAVLMGVLAPQYLRYVEKTRIRADDVIVQEVLNSAMVIFAEGKYYEHAEETPVLSISSGGTITITGFSDTDTCDHLRDGLYIVLYGSTTPKDEFKSKAYRSFFDAGNSVSVTYSYDPELMTLRTVFLSVPAASSFHS